MMTRRLSLTLLAGAVLVLATPAGHAAEIAASIQYDFAQPPAGLSPDFAPREGHDAHRDGTRQRRQLSTSAAKCAWCAACGKRLCHACDQYPPT
jgi:Spy/CpxP family protein refolding chaperone